MQLLPLLLEDLFKDASIEDIHKAEIWLDDLKQEKLMKEFMTRNTAPLPIRVEYIHPMFTKILNS